MYNNKNQGAFSRRYSNYIFAGEGKNEANSGTPLDNPTHTVKVAFNRDMGNVSGNGLENGVLTVKSGDSVTLTATPKAGYHFVQWIGSPSSAKKTNPNLTFDVLSDRSLTALFAKDNPNPGNGGGDGGTEVVVGPSNFVKPGFNPWKNMLKKYWWVLAILVGCYLYKEGKQ